MTTSITNVSQPEKGVKRQKLRRGVLRVTLALAFIAPLTFIVAAIGYKLGVFGLGTSFGLLNMKVGPILLIAAGIAGLISLVLAFTIQPRRGFVVGALALLIGGFGMGKLGATKAKVESLPFIHDITTDTQNPPMFTDAILKLRGSTSNPSNYVGKKDSRDKKLVSVLQTKAFPAVRPLILEDDPAAVFGKAELVASQLGWELVNVDAEAGIIEATDTTFWYGFKDDVIIRIKPSEGGGSVVDARSLSRIGGSDIGKNAERVKDFLERLNAA
ncbi:DUF1499 domain-containing protein [Litorimonas sp. RW-G-Af-16]|uniref:DUF1499 domain-containing protein n=1 Tax=Litorimonas sp. RW-G-Af-16 TaxID=3241168 RepID=UPI00390CB216